MILSRKLRLVDAVAIAALAMLGLKLAGFLAGPQPDGFAAAPSKDAVPAFGRVIAHARTNYVPPEVSMTGTVPPKEAGKEPPKPTGSGAGDTPGPKPTAFEPAGSQVSASERALLERLGERRDELQQRNKDVELRERLLENAERKLEARINELKGIEARQAEEAGKRGDTEAGALRNLVIMYEAMKPKDAARIFDRLSHDVLVPVVLQMKPAKMAEVLAVMSPEAAEKLTVALATRARGRGPEARPSAPAAPNELPAVDEPARR